jgi:hypothetical protein
MKKIPFTLLLVWFLIIITATLDALLIDYIGNCVYKQIYTIENPIIAIPCFILLFIFQIVFMFLILKTVANFVINRYIKNDTTN